MMVTNLHPYSDIVNTLHKLFFYDSVNAMKRTPADKVINAFGGIRPLARILGIDPATPVRWQERGGAIPRWHHDHILRLAKHLQIKLTRLDLQT